MTRPALPARPSRRRVVAGVLAAVASICAGTAHAIGTAIDVQVVDRASGETLTPIQHDGQWWIAGRPGARYGVVVSSRSARRTLAVISVDGVNAFTGATAAWGQSGYVLDPYERTEVDGWRKSVEQVAAFEFTALPDSYAARTGRPANVGVIGVATFGERRRAPARTNAPALPNGEPETPEALPAPPGPASMAQPAQRAAPPAPSMGSPVATDRAALEADATAAANTTSRERLGTGHGALEAAPIRYVRFDRARDRPDEVVTIHYDRIENLIAMGIVPAQPAVAHGSAADAFPGSRRFVPDPPPR